MPLKATTAAASHEDKSVFCRTVQVDTRMAREILLRKGKLTFGLDMVVVPIGH